MSVSYLPPGKNYSLILRDPRLSVAADIVATKWAAKTAKAMGLGYKEKRNLRSGASYYLKLVMRRLAKGKAIPTEVTASHIKYGLANEHLSELSVMLFAKLDSHLGEIAHELNGLADAFSPKASKILSQKEQ